MTAPRIPFARRAWATDDDERYDTDDDDTPAPDYACARCKAPIRAAEARRGYADELVCDWCHAMIWEPTVVALRAAQPREKPRPVLVTLGMTLLVGGVWFGALTALAIWRLG